MSSEIAAMSRMAPAIWISGSRAAARKRKAGPVR